MTSPSPIDDASKQASRINRLFVYRNGFVLLVMAALSWFVLQPVLGYKSWFWSHDQIRYPYLAVQFRDAFLHGILYPRWLPDLMGGYGYPTFVYYQPGFFFFSLPFTLLIQAAVPALKLQIFVLLMIAAGGAYLLAREFLQTLAMRLGAVTLFMTTPYLSTNINFRGALAELQAMVLCPLAVWLVIQYARAFGRGESVRGWLAAFTALITVIVYSHPFVAMYLLPCLGIIALSCLKPAGYSLRYLLLLALCVTCAMILAVPYWSTVIHMRDEISMGIAEFMMPRARTFDEFFNTFFNPGKVHLPLAVVGFYLGRRNRFVQASLLCYALLIFMMSRFSAPLWQLQTPLRDTQFAWRMNSVVATVQLIGILSLMRWLEMRFRQSAFWRDVVFFTLLVIACGSIFTAYRPRMLFTNKTEESARRFEFRPFTSLPFQPNVVKAREEEFNTMTATGEFWPKRANTSGLANRHRYDLPIADIFPGRAGEINFYEDSTLHQIHFLFSFSEDDKVRDFKVEDDKAPVITYKKAGPQKYSSVLINQFFLPGWQVRVNGEKIPLSYEIRHLQDQLSWGPGLNGRMRINFPAPGEYEVRAWYDGPPGWQQRNLMVALGFIICLVAMRLTLRSNLDAWARRMVTKWHA